MNKKNSNITYLGQTTFRKSRKVFGILQSDRFFHTYILGKTGTGKSNLVLAKILQDVKHQRGCMLFDIHGDLIKQVFANIPDERKQDVIFLNIPNPKLGIGYNPIKRISVEKRSLMVSGILESFQKLWSSNWGNRQEHVLRYILLTLADQPKANLRDIIRIIQDKSYRTSCIKNIVNPDVRNFWVKEFPSYRTGDLNSIHNKVGAFLAHPKIKRLLIDNVDNLSFRKAMDNNKIVLINLSKGALGTDVSHVLGSLLLSTLNMATFSRIDTHENRRVPFHIFLDEFQNYTNKSLVSMLSEHRKFKVSYTLCNQYLEQLQSEIKAGVLGNVGTLISFRISASDARYILLEHFKEFQPLTIGDYVSLENHHIFIQLMIRGKPSKVFSAKTLYYKRIL